MLRPLLSEHANARCVPATHVVGKHIDARSEILQCAYRILYSVFRIPCLGRRTSPLWGSLGVARVGLTVGGYFGRAQTQSIPWCGALAG